MFIESTLEQSRKWFRKELGLFIKKSYKNAYKSTESQVSVSRNQTQDGTAK